MGEENANPNGVVDVHAMDLKALEWAIPIQQRKCDKLKGALDATCKLSESSSAQLSQLYKGCRFTAAREYASERLRLKQMEKAFEELTLPKIAVVMACG